jgi:hypothetical protein
LKKEDRGRELNLLAESVMPSVRQPLKTAGVDRRPHAYFQSLWAVYTLQAAAQKPQELSCTQPHCSDLMVSGNGYRGHRAGVTSVPQHRIATVDSNCSFPTDRGQNSECSQHKGINVWGDRYVNPADLINTLAQTCSSAALCPCKYARYRSLRN